ncbi:1680_t:CDS:1 [Cetraspora pellucida]|uniref:1680_t:CDS:1 n=1 Tax=Cetraspora pellucida TaxID=1433469 RepID=A0A9N9EWU0_9GLOM|nr:1680_t:CDS:1 [Cetraspora pellucida]
MSHKQFIIFAITLAFLTTFTYSTPYETIEDDIFEQDINFFCKNGTNLSCCPHLANRIAHKHYSRCASIILINNSGYNMTLDVVNLEDGRWVTSDDYGDDVIDINCKPRTLSNYESEAISSVTNRLLGGVIGYVSYTIDDDMSSKFIISWEVSAIGQPRYYFSFLDKSYTHEYNVRFEQSFGDTVYQVKIDKKIPLMPFFISIFLFILFFPITFCCCLVFGQVSRSIGQQDRQSYESLLHRERQRQPKRQSYNNQYGQQRQYSYNNLNNNQYGQQGQSSYNNFNRNDPPPPYDQIFSRN